MESEVPAESIHYFIAADVGGTNARFRIVKRSTQDSAYRKVVLEKSFQASDFESIDDIFMNLLGSINARISICTLAIAGPKDGRKVQVTNIPKWGWIDAEVLKEKFGFEKFFLLNDFEANGYGATFVDVEKSEDCVVINEGVQVSGGNKFIIGPGTGLGCAIIIYNKAEGDYNVHPGEGGHTEYPIVDEVDLRLKNFAIDYLKRVDNVEIDRVSVERLTAGPALPLIYEFFKLEHPELEVVLEAKSKKGEVSGKEILSKALNEKDPLCVMVLEQFIKHLAILTGDIALITLAYGGIYLCGGVAVALKNYLRSEECKFKQIMTKKGRFSERVANMPVYLLTHEPGLDGAEQYGLQALINNYEE